MCSFVAGVSTAMEIGGNYLGQKAQYEQAQAQIDAQGKAAITKMNYAFQNYEQERIDAFDNAVAEITKVRQNAQQLNSGVKAAVAENASGRTANLIVRAVEGDTARAVGSVKDNYVRKSNEIDLNKEATLKSTADYIKNLNASAPKMPSRFANFLSTSVSVLSNTTAALNQKNSVLASGQKYNWWTGGAKVGAKAGAKVGSTAAKTWVGTTPRKVFEKTGAGTGSYL